MWGASYYSPPPPDASSLAGSFLQHGFTCLRQGLTSTKGRKRSASGFHYTLIARS
ncbi:MAG: hypothetical protein FWF18_01960 [Dehalococcoidia bacterium]|nr:hypothetical protein [Dehalococcoidia bacterium]